MIQTNGGGAPTTLNFIGMGDSRFECTASTPFTILGALDVVSLYNIDLIAGFGAVAGLSVQITTPVLRAYGCQIGEPALTFFGITCNGALAAGSFFRGCSFFGQVASVFAGVPWANAPFYHNRIGTAMLAVTPTAGNTSNDTV